MDTCDHLTRIHLTRQIESKANLVRNFPTKIDVILHLGILIHYSFRSVPDPELDEVFRHHVLSEMRHPKSPECMKAQFRPVHTFQNRVQHSQDVPLQYRTALARSEQEA